MAPDAFERLAEFPAIYFGAVGDPSVPDHIAVWELILPLRQRFDQYVNLRPMRLFPGVTSPLANRGAGRHRHDLRARELRRRVRRHRREDSRGHAVRSGGAGGPLHAPRHQPHRALCLRAGVEASAARAGERDQVERAAALDGAVGHGRRRGAQGLSERRRSRSTTSTRSRRAW